MKQYNCLVTGPTSGIGKAVSFEMSKLGHHVILVGRSDIKLKRMASEIR